MNARYCLERASLASHCSRAPFPRVEVRAALAAASARFEERCCVRTINEVFLMHGTRPETVLPILRAGLNERFSGGHFGAGSYLAEVADKINQ